MAIEVERGDDGLLSMVATVSQSRGFLIKTRETNGIHNPHEKPDEICHLSNLDELV